MILQKGGSSCACCITVQTRTERSSIFVIARSYNVSQRKIAEALTVLKKLTLRVIVYATAVRPLLRDLEKNGQLLFRSAENKDLHINFKMVCFTSRHDCWRIIASGRAKSFFSIIKTLSKDTTKRSIPVLFLAFILNVTGKIQSLGIWSILSPTTGIETNTLVRRK